MKLIKLLTCLSIVSVLAACGAGGGSPGSNNNIPTNSLGLSGITNTTSITSTTGNAVTTTVGSMSMEVIGGSGAASNSISVLEIAQARITLKDKSGKPVPGAVVTFVENVANLLTIAPASKTALTDAAGMASVEIRAISSTSIGATIIAASAFVSGEPFSANKAIKISSAPDTALVISPQDLAQTINFLDVNPADKSIVIQGAGGSGRSESATLRFRVVDKNNTPVKGAVVDFVANPASNVTLNIPSATSDAEGVVVTTVSSKSVATSLVIKATVNGKTISSQSDQLLVTTGVGVQAGFEIGPVKFNLDGGFTGDSTPVTAFIVDANGNPVADGVPVVFTTSGGAIGSSARGGCTTVLDGRCSVVFRVQEPRNNDLALVTGSTQVGTSQTLSAAFWINMSDPYLSFVKDTKTLAPVTTVNLSGCKQSYSGFVANLQGRSAAAGTTVAVKSNTTDFNASVKSGSLILDSLSPLFAPSFHTLEFDASSITAPNNCNPGGFTTFSAQAEVQMTTPVSRVNSVQNVTVTYPGGSVFLADPTTKQTKSELTLLSCGAQIETFQVLTNVPNVSAPAGLIVGVANNGGATTSIISGSPVTGAPADVQVSITAPPGGPNACGTSGTTTSFPMTLVITLPNGVTQIQTVIVKYAKAA
jgi:hypothetical protein